jgi:hypothetical protein
MTSTRIHKLRALAEAHKATRGSAKIILECLDEIESLQSLYCIALDAAYRSFPKRAQALRKLKTLAGMK